MPVMTLAKFNKLSKRDFENGAVLDEIALALKERETMIEILNGVVAALTANGLTMCWRLRCDDATDPKAE
jgi:hypothetical protein